MLIVIEGLDGAGKSTQVKRIKEFITSSGKQMRYLHFPRYDAPIYGDLIAKFLRGDFGNINEVHPQLVALIYALDRKDAAPQMEEWLSSGNVVLLDRYVYSNIAYQCSKITDLMLRKELREWIFNLEYNVYKIPRPDINIFLDVPINFVGDRLSSSRDSDSDREYLNGKRDIHEESIRFQMGVREIYLQESMSDSKFIRIDCSSSRGDMLPEEEIFEKIKPHLVL